MSKSYPEVGELALGSDQLCEPRGFWFLLTFTSVFSKLQDRKGTANVLGKTQFGVTATAVPHPLSTVQQQQCELPEEQIFMDAWGSSLCPHTILRWQCVQVHACQCCRWYRCCTVQCRLHCLSRLQRGEGKYSYLRN